MPIAHCPLSNLTGMPRCTRSSKVDSGEGQLHQQLQDGAHYYKRPRPTKLGGGTTTTRAASSLYGRASRPFPHAWLWGLHGGEEEGESSAGSTRSTSSFPQLLLLPQMERAVAAAQVSPDGVRETGLALLARLAAVLTPTALCMNAGLQPALAGSLPSPLGPTAFLHPAVLLQRGRMGTHRLACLSEEPLPCMEYDKSRVKRSTGMSYDKEAAHGDAHLRVYLGRDASSGAPVFEYGHRIVAWCVFGPPHPGQEVIRTCRNPKCLSPLHMKYGSHAENMAGRWLG